MDSTRRRGPALRLVRIGARELGRDPELAQSVRGLLEVLQRRGELTAAAPSQTGQTWIVALEAAGTMPALAPPQQAAPASVDPAVQRALQALSADLRRRWTVQSLAKAVGLSRAAFARRFASALGVSPIAYLTELRLAQAAQRLSEADPGLAQLAAEVGYASEFAFSRAFKRRYGVPPAVFRRDQAAYRRLQHGPAVPFSRRTGPTCLALAA